MSKSVKWPISMAIFCGSAAVFDFVNGALRGSWISYMAGALMVALTALNISNARKRKAKPVPTGDPGYSLGGYISPSFTLTAATGGNARPSISAAKPTGPKEFSGQPFDLTLGEVYGLRMWRMDSYGRLRARNWTHAEPWRPGVNVAKCVSRAEDEMFRAIRYAAGFGAPPSPKATHDAPSEGCACGFYAYTDSRHAETVSYKGQDSGPVILGIVKGTGRTLIGTQGFRCEKAEIVALRDPTRGGTKNDPWRVQQLANLKRLYPDVPLMPSRAALLEFAPLTDTLPAPDTDEFWKLP